MNQIVAYVPVRISAVLSEARELIHGAACPDVYWRTAHSTNGDLSSLRTINRETEERIREL